MSCGIYFTFYTASAIAALFAGMAFYLYFWRRCPYGELSTLIIRRELGHQNILEEDRNTLGKGHRAHNMTTPTVDSGFYRFVGPVYPYNMKDVFKKGFRQVCRGNPDHLLSLTVLQYPKSAFSTRVFPFGKVTVLTDRKLVDEMNHASPDDLSFDDVSQAVCYWRI